MAPSRRSLLAAFLVYPIAYAGLWHIAFATGPGQTPERSGLYALAFGFLVFVLLLATLQHTLVLSWLERRIAQPAHRWLPGLAGLAALASEVLAGIEWLGPAALLVPSLASVAVYGAAARACPARRGSSTRAA